MYTPQSFGTSPVVWDHLLPATRLKWMHPTKAGTRLTYPRGMEGRWVDLGGWDTEMIYLPIDGHLSNY